MDQFRRYMSLSVCYMVHQNIKQGWMKHDMTCSRRDRGDWRNYLKRKMHCKYTEPVVTSKQKYGCRQISRFKQLNHHQKQVPGWRPKLKACRSYGLDFSQFQVHQLNLSPAAARPSEKLLLASVVRTAKGVPQRVHAVLKTARTQLAWQMMSNLHTV